MKRKSFLLSCLVSFLMIASINQANSQVLISLLLGDKLNTEKLKFGLDGGVNFSTISNIDPSRYHVGFDLGFYFDILLKENTHWYLHTGVLVKSPMGSRELDPYSLNDIHLDSLFEGGSVERQLRYFNVPILARYKFKSGVYIEAGPMLGLLSKARDVFYADVNEKEDLSYINEVRDQYNRIDAGIEAGIGYHVIKGTGYNLGVRYYAGMTEILKDNTGDPNRNSAFYLYASIPVGAGEKAKAKAKAKEEEKEAKKAQKKADKEKDK